MPSSTLSLILKFYTKFAVMKLVSSIIALAVFGQIVPALAGPLPVVCALCRAKLSS